MAARITDGLPPVMIYSLPLPVLLLPLETPSCTFLAESLSFRRPVLSFPRFQLSNSLARLCQLFYQFFFGLAFISHFGATLLPGSL